MSGRRPIGLTVPYREVGYTEKKEWVSLTEDEITQAMFKAGAIVTGPTQFKFARELEEKLKEKNGRNN